MRRIFIIRKDLHLKPGKLAAMIGHSAEAYFTNLLKSFPCIDNEFDTLLSEDPWRPGQPAVYKHPEVCKKAEEAFKAGEKHFKVKTQFPLHSTTSFMQIVKEKAGIFTVRKSQLQTATISKLLCLARFSIM